MRRRRSSLAWLGAALATSLAVHGCRGGNAPPPSPDLLLVTVDTLRRDHLGVYDPRKGVSPRLDGVLSEGVVFEHAFTHVPLTLPSFASLHTGLWPWHHGLHDNGRGRLDGGTVTLGGTLKGAGYRTVAVLGAFPLDSRFGLDGAFDVYDDAMPAVRGRAFEFSERPADAVAQRARSEMQGDAPLFLWVHLYDPHAPYEPPSAYRIPGRTAYGGEVAYATDTVAALIRHFDAVRTRPRVIAFLSDHGESLGEHGETTHGLLGFDGVIGIPLVIISQDLGPRRIEWPMSVADVAPTLLGLLGLGGRLVGDGKDLSVYLRTGGEPPAAPIPFESRYGQLNLGSAPLLGVVKWPHKLMSDPGLSLYDLADDPAELSDLASRDRATVEELLPLLPPAEIHRTPVDRDAQERLRSLGYVAERGPTTTTRSVRSLAPLMRILEDARGAVAEGALESALTRYRTLQGELPMSTSVASEHGMVAAQMGKLPEAEARLSDALALDAANTEARLNIANVCSLTGRHEEAREHVQRILDSEPSNPEGHFAMASVLFRSSGDRSEILRHLKIFIDAAPDDPRAAVARRLVAQSATRPTESPTTGPSASPPQTHRR